MAATAWSAFAQHTLIETSIGAPPMIVMKFGGTSVEDAKAIDRVASIVEGRLAQQPVVVVSAMAKVTDTLLTMARAAGEGERKTALKLCRSLQERHYNTASELLGTARFTEFHSELGADFESLDELLRGISAVGEITPRTTDHVAAFGEMLSSKIVAAAFAARGLNGVHVDSRDVLVTDSAYMQAVPQYEETNAKLAAKGSAAARCGTSSGDGRIHRREPRRASRPRSAAAAQIFPPRSSARAWAPSASRSGPTSTAFSPPIRASAPTRAASRSSASTRPPSWLTSARKFCIRRRCCRRSRKIFRSTC